ncbi:helix-turn-helix domain [Holotrichia oblita]|uniref:Helix-turn-helix domain n=1 Tax=Holotrichia oblita TaxID=644536 RepID=A0ACB9TXJ2_HOLOL|nr:helix-turn-helix domain [Holotrichia oblita]
MNDNYSFEELADMHLAYGAAQCNEKEAARLYEQRYPARRQPHHTTFASIHRRLRESGNLKRPGGSGRPRTACTVQFEEEVLHRVEEN